MFFKYGKQKNAFHPLSACSFMGLIRSIHNLLLYEAGNKCPLVEHVNLKKKSKPTISFEYSDETNDDIHTTIL